MALSTEDLIKYLRQSVNVVDPEADVRDELYLKMTDDDIRLCLDIARTKAFAGESLDDFPEEFIYALILVAKKELYLSLALRHANYIDIGADDNNYLKKSQWFDHYLKLAKLAEDEYNDYLDQGGAGGNEVYSASTYLSTRYYTNYNYEKAKLPYIRAKVDKVTENTIEVSWQYTTDRYFGVSVYVSKHSIKDLYELNGSQISELSTLVATVQDPHLSRCRIGGCESGTEYYILVTLTDWTGRTVFDEKRVTTMSEEEESPDDVVEATL